MLAPLLPVALICAIHVATVAAFYAGLEESAAAPRTATTPTQWQSTINRVELEAKRSGIGELHGLPLRYWQTVADRVKDAAARLGPDPRQPGLRDAIVMTGIQDDGNLHLDKRRKAIDYLLGPELEARFPLEGSTVVPTTVDTLFVTIPEQDLPRAVARGATRLAEISLPGTSGATRVWLVRAQGTSDTPQPRARSSVRFESGVRLLGIDAPVRAQAGQTVPLATYWLVESTPSPAHGTDEPFVELLDGGGATLTRQIRAGLPASSWRTGDLLIQRASFTVPMWALPGEYRIVAGLASREDGSRARVADTVDADAPADATSVPIARLQIR